VLAMAPNTNIGSAGRQQRRRARHRERPCVASGAGRRRVAACLTKGHTAGTPLGDFAVKQASNLPRRRRCNERDRPAGVVRAALLETIRTADTRSPRHFNAPHGRRADRNVKPGIYTRFLSTLIDTNYHRRYSSTASGSAPNVQYRGGVPPHLSDLHGCAPLFGVLVLPLFGGGLILICSASQLVVARTSPRKGSDASGIVAIAVGLAALPTTAPAPYTLVALIVTVTACPAGMGVAMAKPSPSGAAPVRVGRRRSSQEGVVRQGGYCCATASLAWPAAEQIAPGEHVQVARRRPDLECKVEAGLLS